MAYVYRHIRLDKNEPFYIGIGSDKKYKRAHSTKDRNKYWNNIVKKSLYKVEIIFDNLTWEDACKKEIEFIELYGRKDLGLGTLCNLTNGGEGAKGIIYSDIRKKEISQRLSGSNNPFYGKKHSKKTIEILTYLANHRNPETNKKISIANSNKIIPYEVRLKMSNSTIGEKNHFYGKTHSDKVKKVISEKAKGRIICDELKQRIRLNSPKRIQIYRIINNEIFIYKSLREASEKTGIARTYIKNHMDELGFKIDIKKSY